jgi:hypothetical protein
MNVFNKTSGLLMRIITTLAFLIIAIIMDKADPFENFMVRACLIFSSIALAMDIYDYQKQHK